MGLTELYLPQNHTANAQMASHMSEAVQEMINQWTVTGQFTQNPQLEITLENWMERATAHDFSKAFYNEHHHPDLNFLRSIINRLPINEARGKCIELIKNRQIAAAEQTLQLNRQLHLTQSLEDLGIFEDTQGTYLQTYNVAHSAGINSGFGPIVSYYDTTYDLASFDDDENPIYKNIAVMERITCLTPSTPAPNRYLQLAQLSQSHGMTTWILAPRRQEFLEKNSISVIVPYADGPIASGLKNADEIFDLLYLLFSDNPSTRLFVDATKHLYTR